MFLFGASILLVWTLNVATAANDNEFTPRLDEVRRAVRDGNIQEEYGYVNVRPAAHFFYWLQYTTHPDGYLKRPLLFWHQGGPGGSATGIGNFEIIGPEDTLGNKREDTWLQSVSIVYLDSPVGTGFSYVDDGSAYARDLQTMADDLVAFSKVFFENHDKFKNTPLWIFGESYGGKVAAAYSQALEKAVRDGQVNCTLRGYAMGDAWTSPMDSVNTWGSYLYEMSVIDEVGLAAVEAAAAKTQRACDNGRWEECTSEWSTTEYVIMEHSNYVSFYNILEYMEVGYNAVTYHKATGSVRSTRRHPSLGLTYDIMLAPYASDNLYDYMNKEVRERVGIIPDHINWSDQSGNVFKYNEGDFMKDCLQIVDDTLNNTKLHVVIYQGQLDLICDTVGAMDWTQRLRWPGMKSFNAARRRALVEPTDGQTDTYVKAHDNFKFYWNLRAGHMVPADMGPAALRMLARIINDVDR